MAFPILPAVLAVGAVVWAWWLGKNSQSQTGGLDFDDKIVEATIELLPYELLPYKEGKPLDSDAPDILLKIAAAIKETGATSTKDLEKVLNQISPSDQKRASLYLITLEFLEWLEQNRRDSYETLALPYRPDTSPTSSTSPDTLVTMEEILASIHEWHSKKKENSLNLPIEIAKDCGCRNKKGKPKKIYTDRALANKTAAYWSKKNNEKQESYLCPHKKGFHIRTCRQ